MLSFIITIFCGKLTGNIWKLHKKRGELMSKHLSKEEIVQNKKKSIIQLSDLLESYIARDDQIRKADLVSKWIKDYVKYLKFEEHFDPIKNITYKRGNIIKVNFGFNIGAELGGVHYAVVLDKDNKHSSSTVTIAPMSSVKPNKPVHKNNLNIGAEFYNLLNSRLNILSAELDKELFAVQKYINLFDEFKKIYNNDNSSAYQRNAIIKLSEEYRVEAENKLDSIHSQMNILKKNQNELMLMSHGSIIKLDQIRTISKIRINIPKHKNDVLYELSLSNPTMTKVSEKLKDLYIF